MNKFALHLLGVSLVSCTLACAFPAAAKAEALCPTTDTSLTESSESKANCSGEHTHSLDELQELFHQQQRLLEEQTKLIKEQQLQIDDMRSQIEELKQSGQQLVEQTAQTEPSTTLAKPAQTAAATDGKTLNSFQTSAQADKPDTDELSKQTNSGDLAQESEETEDLGPEPPSASEAPQEATAQASGQQPDLNPNISLILLGGGQLGGAQNSSTKNTFFVQEAELNIAAPVDPSTHLEATFAAHHNESPELEEAFIRYMGLTGGLQLRAGKMRQELGALNSTHTHALPQIDCPLPYSEFLGEEGLATPGVELSWLLPTSWYSKATVSVSSRAGAHVHNHDEESEHEEEFALFSNEGKHNPLFTARWENMAELNDDTTLTLGLSHASSSIDSEHVRSSSINGADLTLKWSPASDPYREFVWRSEYMKAHQSYKAHEHEEISGAGEHVHEHLFENKNLSGWYTYLAYRFNRNFRLGARYDQADSPIIEKGITRRTSAFAEYIANEWNSIRLQFNHTSPNWQPGYNELLLQWNVVIGPHGAHKY